MRQVTRKGLITMAAATGVIAMTGGYAHADSAANGSASGSPGVLSGNTIQAPVHVPVNACGNTVNVIGVLNPAVGNRCVNSGGSHHGSGGATAHGHASDSPGVGSGNTVQAPIDVPVNACGNSATVIGGLNPVFGNDCANVSDTGHHQPPHHPGHPGQPGHPGHPGQPGHPGKPGEPCGPEHPGTPHQPGKPGGVVSPIHGTKPGQHPHAPGTPGKPGTPGTTAPATHTTTPATGSAAALAHTGSDAVGVALPAGAGLVIAGTALYRRARAGA
ncbi:chaplin [Streptomyces sp. NPDC020719]|uniref:chaplin n=1 Tax=unclassified Streptomyces TaxID=2593676 RepID=UPI0033C7AF8A